MHRAIPTGNKLLSKKWSEKEREIHMTKLKEIKATVEIREPPKFRHIVKKQKKTQLMEDRYTEIERENRILLEKMTNIMSQTNSNNKTAFTSQYASSTPIAGSVMHPQNSTQNQNQNQYHHHSAMMMQNKRSLNKESRKRELLKITMENQTILRRLQDKQSNYNVNKWQEEAIEKRKILKNICEYPLLIDDRRSPSSQHQYQSQANYTSGPPDFIIKKKGGMTSSGPFFKKRGYTGSDGNLHLNHQIQLQNQNGIEKKQLCYTGPQDLGNGQYYVEIVITQENDLVISAQHYQKSDSFVIEISADKVEQLITEFNCDYNRMAAHLKIMNKRMVLLNPRFTINQASHPEPNNGSDHPLGHAEQQQQQQQQTQQNEGAEQKVTQASSQQIKEEDVDNNIKQIAQPDGESNPKGTEGIRKEEKDLPVMENEMSNNDVNNTNKVKSQIEQINECGYLQY